MLNALVIDDEILAREELIAQLNDNGCVEVIGQAGNAIDGLKMVHRLKPDILFLDIQMPQISGMELLAMLDPDNMPYVVFVTAYDQYAIQAFEENAFDYLLKPIDQQRLNKTIGRIERSEQKEQDISNLVASQLEQIPCVGLNRIILIPTHEVEFACSELTGVLVQTKHNKATSQLSLKLLEEKTPLIRCHRQYLINPKAIREIKLLENGLAEVITCAEHSVPVSRRYLKPLKEALGLF